MAQRILFYTGLIDKMGDVDDGNTVTDWMEEERERGLTITSAATTCYWTQKDDGVDKLFTGIQHRVNIIDTPGHVDFTAEVERSLRVLDGVIAVFCGVAGVQPQSETVWRQANKYKVPRIAFVNKMDRVGANFESAVKEMRQKLGANAWPILIPIGKEDHLKGCVDVISEKAIIYDPSDTTGMKYDMTDIPADLVDEMKLHRMELIEAVANVDDVIADKFLHEQPIDEKELRAGIRRVTVAGKFVPVVGGSAYKNKNVQPLIDAVVDFLPNPLDVGEIHGFDTDDHSPITIHPDDNAKDVSLAFKLWSDPFIGKLVFFRVYTGKLTKGDSVYNPRSNKTDRVSRVIMMQADKREEVDIVYSGDIAALVGLKNIVTGDTLCDPDFPILLEPPTFPEPVISMAVEPKTKADREKMGEALQRLAEEDPTFRVKTNEETGQLIIHGMGELHLEIIRDRMFREFKVEANAGKPQIAFRETITKPAEGEGKFIRQSGGRGQYGHALVTIEPNPRGKGVEILNEIVGGAIPKEYIPAVIDGIEEAVAGGVLAGYPMVDMKVAIVDGTFHEVDSSELAFKMAGIFALKDAVKKAHAILLEPIMKVEVTTPEEYQGDLLGDLNRRRGKIVSIEAKDSSTVLNAEVPLAEMFGYATAIRSLSKGRAAYSMEPFRFEPVPNSIVAGILDTAKNRPAART